MVPLRNLNGKKIAFFNTINYQFLYVIKFFDRTPCLRNRDKYILYCRVITKRIQQLKRLDTDTETSSEDDDTETDEGYADAEYSNTSSEENDEDDE